MTWVKLFYDLVFAVLHRLQLGLLSGFSFEAIWGFVFWTCLRFKALAVRFVSCTCFPVFMVSLRV